MGLKKGCTTLLLTYGQRSAWWMVCLRRARVWESPVARGRNRTPNGSGKITHLSLQRHHSSVPERVHVCRAYWALNRKVASQEKNPPARIVDSAGWQVGVAGREANNDKPNWETPRLWDQMIEKAHHLGTETGLEMQRTTELHLEHLEACLSDLMGVLLSYSHDLSYSADFKSGWVYGSNCSFWPSLRLPIHSSLSVSLFLAACPPLKQGNFAQ